MTRRAPALVLALLLSTTALGLATPSRAEASCVGPFLGVGTTIDDTGAVPGAPPELPRNGIVTGLWFHTGCDDGGVAPGPGCSATPADEERAMRDVDLVLTQGEQRWELGTSDAASQRDHYAVTWDVTLPDDALAGPATLTAGTSTLDVTLPTV